MSKKLFWFLSFTWGLPMTLAGLISAFILKAAGFTFNRNQYGWVVEVGEDWGGLTLGPFIFVNKEPSQHILDHEFGHSLQNCYFGPFMILISIASAIRYWYREIMFMEGISYTNMPAYDDIWFEGTATYLGKHYHKFTN